MLANDLKETRSQFLEGKTELTNEDIIHLLDLSPEKTAANIEIYTEKSYKELKGNPEELARLTKELTSAEYLRYKETFISKSKLLYEQSSVLYNEIPCLIVLNEIKIPSYLLPYEYAKNKQGDTRHFADSLKENAFTDFKRLFNLRLKHSFDKGLEQGRDIFFLVNNEKLDKEEIKKQLEKLIKFHKGSDKQGLFLFYSEKDYKCFSFESDYSGKITENNDYDLKKLRLAISDKPFTPNLERTNTNERPRSSNLNISPSNMSVNELFYSLLKRGEITALATLKDLSDRENRYYEAVSDMERTNNTIFSDFLKKSNTAFLLKEKQSRFYKDIFKLIPQGERTMEKEKIEIQTYKFQNGETIDEILSKQTSWATDEEFLDNMIDNSLREVADFADEKENELLKKISIAKNNPEVDLKLLAVQTDAAARYMSAKHYDYRLADVGNRPFSKDFINPYAQDDFPYELPSWIKNHLEEYPNQNEPEHTSEEEKAYQEWEEMLEDNQREENIISHNVLKTKDSEKNISNTQREENSYLNSEELKSSLKKALNEIAKPLEVIPFTRENYNLLFPHSHIISPIENVKLGEHQFEKLDIKERQHILKAVHDTVATPDIIINEKRKTVFDDEKEAHVYAKAFKIDGKNKAVQSVVVSIEDENVSISTHLREINNVVNKIKMPEQLIFASTEIGQMVERLTGKQLGTVNPTRENEIFAPPVTTIPQNTENSINYHGLTLTKKDIVMQHKSLEKEDLLNVINFSNWTYFNSEKISTKVYDVEISASLYEQLLPSEYKERSIKEDEVVCIQYRKSVLSEEQDQFLIEKFDKNNFMLLQQKEIQIDVELKNKIKSICNSYIEPQNNNSYTDEILDKIRAAGIEVVTDKDEFDRIATEKTNGRPDIALNQLYHDKFDEYKTKREELAKINDEDIVMQHKSLEDEWISKKGNIDVNIYERERAILNSEIESRNITGGDYWKIVEEQNSNLKTLNDYAEALKNNSQLIFKNPDLGNIVFDNGFFGNPDKNFKGGYGIKHLIASRSQKDNMSIDAISALLLKVKDVVESVKPEDPSKDHMNLIKDGIWVGISKQWSGTDETWIITGFPEKENANSFTKEATDTIQTVIARNSYALEHSSIREQVGAVVKSIALDNEKSTIKNNNEKSQERHSDAKDYLIQTTRLFLSKLKEKNLPFLKGKEQGSIIIIKPQVVRDAATGKAFTGYTQLMAQALIQALYDQKKLPELEYDLITYDQAKACGTFIKKGSPHITLTNYNRTTNSASKQMYYFKSGCNSPEMIDLHKESIARNRAIKRIRLSLEEKEIPSERQTEEKNKITLLHYEEMTYLKALNKDTEQYFDSLLAEEKNMLTELCKKTPLTQKTVKELAETLRKDRLISTQLSLQKNSERYFDATECIVPEDFIAKAMAAASLGCSLETTEKTIDSITKDLHQTLSKNIDHYDYGKAFEVGEVITEKCIKNCKEMKNQEYEAAELAKKLEQKQQELKKNPINLLMELLNKNDLSNRTIGGYER